VGAGGNPDNMAYSLEPDEATIQNVSDLTGGTIPKDIIINALKMNNNNDSAVINEYFDNIDNPDQVSSSRTATCVFNSLADQ